MAKQSKRTGKGKGTGTTTGTASTYVSPGVYVEEIPSGARPIEGVGTSVAAFVGDDGGAGGGSPWRLAGTLFLLVTCAAAGVWAWRQRATGRFGA